MKVILDLPNNVKIHTVKKAILFLPLKPRTLILHIVAKQQY